MIDMIRKISEPLLRRVQMLVTRGVVQVVTEGGMIQKVQISMLADEVSTDLDRIQEFGFTSVPAAGAQGVALFLGGLRDHGMVLGTEDGRYRPTDLVEGESCQYSKAGARVHLKADKSGRIYVTKLQIANDSNELITVLSNLVDKLETLAQQVVDARTLTSLGPQPVENVAAFATSKTDLAAIKAQIDTFKV